MVDAINNREDLQKFPLTASDIGEDIQENVNLIVTYGKSNDATVLCMLHPTYKNILEKPNPYQKFINSNWKWNINR